MKLSNKGVNGFTLVELIVVITILAILGTISFISLQSYTREARDAKRLSDVNNLFKKISVERTKGVYLSNFMSGGIDTATGLTLGGTYPTESKQGKVNFLTIKEEGKNFTDPNGNDYVLSYAIGGNGTGAYKFIQLATINEEKNEAVVVGDYYKLQEPDSESLVFTDPNNTNSPLVENNKSSLPYSASNLPPPEVIVYIDGECGSDSGISTFETPVNLCNIGISTGFVDSGVGFTYNWTCTSPNGGVSPSCSANHINNPYTFSAGQITAYNVSVGGTSLVIPSSIGGVAVTSIGANAFMGKGITSVIIPNSVTSIGTQAFRDNQISSLTLPNGITSIGSTVFYNNKLTSITLPNSVTSIGTYAFCANLLTSIEIPNSVTTISSDAFSNNKLANVTIPNSVTNIGNGAFGSQSGLLGTVYGPSSLYVFDRYLNNIGTAFDITKLKSYRYSCTSTTCPLSAFTFNETKGEITGYDGTLGTNVVIPGSINGIVVKSIGNNAFLSKGLTGITIPDSVTNIGNNAFQYNSLVNVLLPSGLINIGSYSFYGNAIVSVIMPNSVITVGDNAYRDNQISTLTLSSGLTGIGSTVFYNNKLTSVIIPNSITSIGTYAFCLNLLTSVVIPTSVITISSDAFSSNKLVSVTIPSSVTNIGNGAFASQSGGTGTVYGPVISGYIFNRYSTNTGTAFDKTKLTLYEANQP